MTHNQLRKIIEKYGLSLEYVDKWECPTKNDARILTMPNVPRPLHSLAPRTILGNSAWNQIRRECYERANDTCEVCGCKPDDMKARQAHELYHIDYVKGESKFVRTICLCKTCHLLCIHTGRALTLWSKGSPLISTKNLLDGAEHAFAIISSYNQKYKAELKVYSTFAEYLKHDELREPMLELIKKYDVKFYSEDPKKIAPWGEWRLILDGEEYPTPYKNEKEWEKAMEKKTYNDKFGKGVEINVRPLTDEEVKAEHDKLKQF